MPRYEIMGGMNRSFVGAPQGPTTAPAIKRKLDAILPESIGS
jgi:hypothetical protein